MAILEHINDSKPNKLYLNGSPEYGLSKRVSGTGGNNFES